MTGHKSNKYYDRTFTVPRWEFWLAVTQAAAEMTVQTNGRVIDGELRPSERGSYVREECQLDEWDHYFAEMKRTLAAGQSGSVSGSSGLYLPRGGRLLCSSPAFLCIFTPSSLLLI